MIAWHSAVCFRQSLSLSFARMSGETGVAQKIDQAIEKMPSISPVFNKLTEMARNLETDSREMVKVIMLDPVLTAKVIKLVNSAFYGLKNPVHSLADAILFLGVNTVKNLAMSTAVMDKILVNQKDAPLDPEAFWKHCLATAVGSKMLARITHIESIDQEIYFLAGLLHDLGKVLFIQAVPDLYRVVIQRNREKQQAIYLDEREELGVSHAQAGGVLARKWKMDQLLVEVMECHHEPEAANSDNPILKLVVVANNLCKQNGLSGGDPCIDPAAEVILQSLGLESGVLQPIIDQLPQELEKAAQFLGIQSQKKSS